MTTPAPQRLDRSEMRHNLDKFKLHWRERLDSWTEANQGAIEKKYAQSFWADFLACFGVSAARMDLFEQDAKRASTGNTGYIDLFWPSVVIGEAKKPGVDLQLAVDQARDYLQGGSVSATEQPRYILASDFETFRLLRLGDPEQRFDVTFPLGEVTDHVDELKFLAGYDESMTREEEQAASIKASKIMANLFTAMAGDEVDEDVADAAPTNPEDEDEEVQRTSVFLTRLLFLLFGDDAGLWEQDLFYRFVHEHTTSENLGGQLDALFDVLNTPETKRRRVPESMAAFPYVNGSLFDRAGELRTTTFFSPAMREALLEACRFHWTDISPAIFGSLFQLVKSKEARRGDGEHYTSEKNILKTLGPLFLDELRAEADRLIANVSTTQAALRAFRDSLATHAFIDPACGSGNFLLVAYRELRRIETDIIVDLRRREGNTDMALNIAWEQKLSISQFYGIELNWWPAKIAETAMFLIDHQANRELADKVGQAPERLPITITAHIHHGNALAVDWAELVPEVSGQTYVFGNPPFLGDHTRTKEQLEDLQRVWGGIKTSRLDFVTGWHAQALRFFHGRDGSFAFVTTNSITQGDQTARLFGPIFDAGWRIKFAHRTFTWDSEAPGKAAVHCVIIGFDRGRNTRPHLWDYPHAKSGPVELVVEQAINAYLVDGPNVLVTKRSTPLSPALPQVEYGSKASDGGYLTVQEKEFAKVTQDPVMRKYLRPYIGSEELINGKQRWCLWLTDLDPSDLAKSPALRERIEGVRTSRAASKAETTRDYPHHHLFRQIGLVSDCPIVGIPEVSSENRRYLPVGELEPGVIISNKVYGAVDPEGFLFAIASSSMFMVWMKTVGGRLESRISFSSTITWNNFALPALGDATRQRIIAAGQKVLAARELHPERSLAEHYNPLAMDPALVKAHEALDKEVDRAMGAPRKLTSERQRQELLFKNYSSLNGN
uniref:DNA methyltransferase n=2 Tax=Corynebacterium sanguinis TaxID=2594913 RepID=UPI002882EBEA|nr:DNA methyltransferase [Corynebacterium sanguinis]